MRRSYDNVTRSSFFGYWHQRHYDNYRNSNFDQSFVGEHLLLTSSKTIISAKTIISTIIDQVTIIEDEWRVMTRCRKFPIIIIFPREYQFLSTLRSMYIFTYTCFFLFALILSSLSDVYWIVFVSTHTDSAQYWPLLLLDLCLCVSVMS